MRALACLLLIVAGVAAQASDEVAEMLERVDASKGRDRVIAMRACTGRDDPRVVERAARMSRGGSVAERMVAVQVLGSVGGDDAIAALVAVSKTDETAMLRGNALEELGRLGHAPSFDRMVAALDVHGARTSAIDGLRLLGDVRAYEPVCALYAARPDDPYVHEAAPEALIALDRGRAVPLLIERFRACGPGERHDVARALASGPDERVVAALLGELEGEERLRRRHAIRALAGAGDSTTIERLVAHADRLPEDRAVTANAIGTAPDGAVASQPLVLWLRETDVDRVRAACAHALGRLDVKGAAPAVANALAREPRGRPAVRMMECLATLGDARAVASLAGVLDDDTWIAQDGRISAINGFPENVMLREVAAWALLTLRDGREPFPRSDLSQFRQAPRPHLVGRGWEEAREWWRLTGKDDPAFRFGD
jgi:HEAT repeat protein